MRQKIKNNQLLVFAGLAYFYSWAVWAPLVLSRQGLIDAEVPAWLHLVGAWGPLAAAFTVTAIAGGFNGLADLARRMARWKVSIKWVLAAFSPLLLFLIALAVDNLITGTPFDFNLFGYVGELPGVAGILGWLVMFASFGLGEETGWRGFALPRLQTTRTAYRSTLILAALWLGWHAPMFFYKESFMEMGFFGFAGWAVSLAFGAVVLTWLYNSSRGSILMVAIWHATFNAAVASPQGNIGIIASVLVIFWAVRILRTKNPESLSDAPKQVVGAGASRNMPEPGTGETRPEET